eukprot:jgi/Psemu1/289684/fgenesh1_pg.389_\
MSLSARLLALAVPIKHQLKLQQQQQRLLTTTVNLSTKTTTTTTTRGGFAPLAAVVVASTDRFQFQPTQMMLLPLSGLGCRGFGFDFGSQLPPQLSHRQLFQRQLRGISSTATIARAETETTKGHGHSHSHDNDNDNEDKATKTKTKTSPNPDSQVQPSDNDEKEDEDESHLNWKDRKEAPKWMRRIAPSGGGRWPPSPQEAVILLSGLSVFVWSCVA